MANKIIDEKGANKENDGNDDTGSKEYNVATYSGKVMESWDNNWRIVVGTLVVKPGDIITWEADRSAMKFGFPVNMEEYFELKGDQFHEKEESEEWPEFEGETPSYIRKVQHVEEGETLVLKVRTDAPEEKIEYDIFVKEGDKFVIGNSPAVIIQRPYRT